jgi:hypothetical protein
METSSSKEKRWKTAGNIFTGTALLSLLTSIAESNSSSQQESTYALYGAGASIALTIGALTLTGLHSMRGESARDLVSEIETSNLQEFAREDFIAEAELAKLMTGKPTRSSE